LNTLTIAKYGNNSLFLDGKIDHVLVWNRALSATEVRQLYLDPICFMQHRMLILPGGAAAAPITIAGTGGAISEFAISEAPISGSPSVPAASGHLLPFPWELTSGNMQTLTGGMRN
jgi:hypothetical protein